MRKSVLLLMLSILMSVQATAATVAYWRFEEGPAGSQVHKAVGGSGYEESTMDSSGNGYDLSVWDEGGAGYIYRTDLPGSPIPQTGAVNNFSVKNAGGGPAMWTNPAENISKITPAAFTIEISIKPENGGYRTYIGRDSRGTVTALDQQGLPQAQSGDLSGLYLQAITNGEGLTNALAIKFCDVSGIWHQAVSANNVFQGYTWSSDPDGLLGKWYNVAAVSDGTYLSLYLRDVAAGTGYQLIAQTHISLRSTNTALTAGLGGAGDWTAGEWTVGRGLFAGGHGDRGYGYIDEVRISDIALTPNEFLFSYRIAPYDPVVNQTADQPNNKVNVTLNWKAGEDPNKAISGYAVLPGIVDQYVFMKTVGSTDPNLYYVGATGIDPGTADPSSSYEVILDFDSSYQWAVVEALEGTEQSFTVGVSTLSNVDPNNITGPIWTFASLSSIPSITDQPDGVLADTGGTAVFTVSADSISTEHFAWWKSADKANNTATDDVPVGTGSATLTLSSVGVSSEGFYYCVVTNDSGTPVASDVAFLEIKRQVAWYKFEDDITDSSGNGNNGTAIKADANFPFTYVDGKVLKAISLNGTDEAVEIPRTIQNSMTIELWIKTTNNAGTGNWWNGRGLVDGDMPGGQNDFGAVLLGNGFGFGVGNPDGASTTLVSVTNINDGEWHYCVATREHVTGQITIYVDGEQEASGTAPLGTKDAPEVLRIGSLLAAANYLAGQIDEVKLYNYPLAELTVASQYYTVTSQKPCVLSQKPNTKYDLNGDCTVDIKDFAEFAAAWLDCGLFPNCQ
jgi:hypothetical protein